MLLDKLRLFMFDGRISSFDLTDLRDQTTPSPPLALDLFPQILATSDRYLPRWLKNGRTVHLDEDNKPASSALTETQIQLWRMRGGTISQLEW